MPTSLDQYRALLDVARADVRREKQAFFGRLGSSGQMRRAIGDMTQELADDHLRAMALASKGTDDALRGGPTELGNAIMSWRHGDDVARGGGEAIERAVQEGGEAAAEQAPRQGLGPLGVAGLLGLGGAGAYAAHRHGQARGREEGNRKRNLAFGAGLATGAVAPKLLQQAGGAISSMGGQLQRNPYYGGYS